VLADLLSEVLIFVKTSKPGLVPIHFTYYPLEFKVRSWRKSARGNPLDEETQNSKFSPMTVMPIIQAGAAVDNQKIVFHSLKYRGV
jgi:hypothetical protein